MQRSPCRHEGEDESGEQLAPAVVGHPGGSSTRPEIMVPMPLLVSSSGDISLLWCGFCHLIQTLAPPILHTKYLTGNHGADALVGEQLH